MLDPEDRSALDDFRRAGDFPAASMEKWGPRVPPYVVDIWRTKGLGDFLGGYLKVIDPEEFAPLLEDMFFDARSSTPIFATAFADLIVWAGGAAMPLLEFRREHLRSVSAKYFIPIFGDNEAYTVKYLDMAQYAPAVKRLGVPDYDECYAYEPLLALGGPERADHLSRVKLREHLVLMASLTDCLRE